MPCLQQHSGLGPVQLLPAGQKACSLMGLSLLHTFVLLDYCQVSVKCCLQGGGPPGPDAVPALHIRFVQVELR